MTEQELNVRRALCEDYDARLHGVNVEIDGDTVTVSRMYEHCETDAVVDALLLVLGAEFTLQSQSSEAGCETCDYGSRYASVYVRKQEETRS